MRRCNIHEYIEFPMMFNTLFYVAQIRNDIINKVYLLWRLVFISMLIIIKAYLKK